MAERLGLRWHTDIDKLQASPAKARTWGAFTLGVADTTPLEMAGAYATVAADGMYCQPLPMQSISDPAVSVGRRRRADAGAEARQPQVRTGHLGGRRPRPRWTRRGASPGTGPRPGNCGGWATLRRCTTS